MTLYTAMSGTLVSTALRFIAILHGSFPMDKGTLQDYLEDILEERNKALADRDRWRILAEATLEQLQMVSAILEGISERLRRG